MRCPGCGRDIVEDMRFCQYCGYQIPGGTQLGPPIARPAQERSHVVLVTGVVVIATIVIVAAVLLVFYGLGSSAFVEVRVQSTHLLFSVEFTLSVDNDIVKSGTLEPGEMVIYTHTYRWMEDSRTIYVSAASNGGGRGSASEIEILTMWDGGEYTMDFYV